jgi:hypothetical protein
MIFYSLTLLLRFSYSTVPYFILLGISQSPTIVTCANHWNITQWHLYSFCILEQRHIYIRRWDYYHQLHCTWPCAHIYFSMFSFLPQHRAAFKNCSEIRMWRSFSYQHNYECDRNWPQNFAPRTMCGGVRFSSFGLFIGACLFTATNLK